MTPEEIKQKALSNLTDSYAGEEPEYAGEYVGFDDDLVDFGSMASSFLDEHKAGRNFSVTFKLTGTATGFSGNPVIAILPNTAFLGATPTTAANIAMLKSCLGVSTIDYICCQNDTAGTELLTKEKLTVNGSPRDFRAFMEFCKHNPTRITGIKMLTDDTTQSQFNNHLQVYHLDPFKTDQLMDIVPDNFKSTADNDSRRVEVPTHNLQLDDQTVILIQLTAPNDSTGVSLTYNFFAGAMLNKAVALTKKAGKAKATIAKKTFGNPMMRK